MRVQPIFYSLSGVPYIKALEKPKDFTSFEYEKKETITPSLDTLQAYSNVSFGYNCELKRLVKKGRIKLRYSFYGGKLNPKKVSIEHIIPHSKGGKSCQSNYVLCNKEQNWERGNNPIEDYLDWEAAGKYLDQFRGLKIGGFDGDEYIKQVLNSINTALKTGR